MAANWSGFKKNLINFMENHKAKDEKDCGKFIAKEYDACVKKSKDIMFRNGPQMVNKSILEAALINALVTASKIQKGSASPILTAGITQGLMGYWTGGMMQMMSPPPGTISIVSNNITSPGVVSVNIPSPNENVKLFVNALATACQMHLMSVMGLTIAMTPMPPGSPVPLPYPWSGIS